MHPAGSVTNQMSCSYTATSAAQDRVKVSRLTEIPSNARSPKGWHSKAARRRPIKVSKLSRAGSISPARNGDFCGKNSRSAICSTQPANSAVPFPPVRHNACSDWPTSHGPSRFGASCQAHVPSAFGALASDCVASGARVPPGCRH